MTKQPWQENPNIWTTEAKWWAWVRGGIRRGLWEKNPVKLNYIKDNRFKAPLGRKTKKNPEGMVWACECEICGKTKRQSLCQVDHKIEAGSLKSFEDLEGFITRLVAITDDDVQIACKSCHSIKTYAERHNISYEEADQAKLVIAIMNATTSEELRKSLIRDFGFKHSSVRNAKQRRAAVAELVEEKAITWDNLK